MSKENEITMEALHVVALTNFLAAKDTKQAKQNLPENFEQNCRFVVVFEDGPKVDVDALVKKGEDTVMNVTASLPKQAMLMHLLAKMPKQVRQKFLRDFANGEVPEISEELEKEMMADWQTVANETKKTTSGKVKVASQVKIS